jgi:hypothetical protein
MLAFKQIEGLETIFKKLGIIIIIHIENINFTNIDNYHKLTNKHISYSCKFDENMNKFQQGKNA